MGNRITGEEKSIKLNFIMNAILTMSSFIVPLITFPYISRVLFPEGVGKYNFAVSLVAYFNMFAQLGIPTYGIKVCAKVRDNREALSRTVRELLFLNMILATVSYLVLIAAVVLVPRLRNEKALYLITGTTILFTSFGMEWLYQGLEEYSYITIRSVIFKGIAVIAMFLLVYEKTDYVKYAAIQAFATGASYILNFINSKKYIDLRVQGGIDIRHHLRPILVFFALVCTTTIYTNLDNVMLGFMKDDIEVGLYSTAVKIKTILVSLITSLGAVLLPRAAYYVEQGEMERFREIVSKALRFVLLSALPVTIYFILYAEEGILFIAGSAFEGSVRPMQIIMPTVLFIGITNILGLEIMVPTGREKLVLYSTIFGAATDIILNLLLIPKYGASGAAIGTLAAEGVVLAVQIRFLKGEVYEFFRDISLVRFFLTALSSGIAALFIKRLHASIFVILLLSAVLYFGLYIIMNFELVVSFVKNQKLQK